MQINNISDIKVNLTDYNYNIINDPCVINDIKNGVMTNTLDIECVYKSVNSQLTAYFINTGIFLIASYIIYTWLFWVYVRFLRKKYYIVTKFTGDTRKDETMAYWDLKIRHYFGYAFCSYIFYVIYLNL